jgi:hypothetical protein
MFLCLLLLKHTSATSPHYILNPRGRFIDVLTRLLLALNRTSGSTDRLRSSGLFILNIMNLLQEVGLDTSTLPGGQSTVEDTVDFLEGLALSLIETEEGVDYTSTAEDAEGDVCAPLDLDAKELVICFEGWRSEEYMVLTFSKAGGTKYARAKLKIQLVAAQRPIPLARHLSGKTSEQ